MPINALINLQARPANFARAAQGGANARRLVDFNRDFQGSQETRDRTREATASGVESQAKTTEQNRMLRNLAVDAAQISPYLKTGEVDVALSGLQKRRARIQQEGGDTSHTDAAIAAVSGGNPDEIEALLGDFDRAQQTAQQFGLMNAPAAPPKPTGIDQKLLAEGLTPNTPAWNARAVELNSKSGTTVNISPEGKGDTVEQEALAKARVSEFQGIQDSANNALDQNEQLEQMVNMDITTGFGQETRAVLASAVNGIFGAGVGDDLLNTSATAMQSFRAVSKRLQATELNKAKGPQTEGDAKRIMDTLANMGNEQDANRFLIRSLQATNQRKIEQADFYQNILERDGSLKSATKEWSAYKRKTPMVSDSVRDQETGLPMFYSDFVSKAKERNPMATDEQIVNAWREMQ